MDHAETIAKLVLEAVLSGAKLEYRPRQSHGEYDFDLHYPDGTIAAVEVTASVAPLQKQLGVEIRRKRNGGRSIEATKCKRNWIIRPTMGASIPKIRKEADTCLSKLEEARIESFSGPDEYAPDCVIYICSYLGIGSGTALPATVSPKIFMSDSFQGGRVGPDVAIKAGELEAWKNDNRRKLAAARMDERHIVVYMDADLPSHSLSYFDPPSKLPSIPKEMTHIWLISHSEEIGNEWDGFDVWRASAKEQWHSCKRVFIPHETPAIL